MQWSFYLFDSQPFTQGKTEKRISLLECFPCRSIYPPLSSCASPLEKDLQEGESGPRVYLGRTFWAMETAYAKALRWALEEGGGVVSGE